jgi:hypothetical protein
LADGRGSDIIAPNELSTTGDGKTLMPSLFRLLFVIAATSAVVYASMYVLATRFEPEQQTISKPVQGVKIRRQ